MKKLGIALALLSVFGLIGMVGAQSWGAGQTITASFTGSYTPATCVLSVADAGITQYATSIDLSSGTGTLNVENSGTPDSASNPSSMPVYVAYQDNGGAAELAPSNGWYQGSTWFAGISTSWTASGGAGGPAGGPWDLQGETSSYFTESPAYSALASNGGWQPITFSVSAPTTLTGTYNQQIVITGSC